MSMTLTRKDVNPRRSASFTDAGRGPSQGSITPEMGIGGARFSGRAAFSRASELGELLASTKG